MNKVILVGRLGHDPQVKYANSGTAVVNFSMATSERYKQKEHTEWHRIVAFSRIAEVIAEYLKKGSMVSIIGKLQTKSYDKDGVTRYSTEILLDSVEFLSGYGNGNGNGNDKGKSGDQKPDSSNVGGNNQDDDIPF